MLGTEVWNNSLTLSRPCSVTSTPTSSSPSTLEATSRPLATITASASSTRPSVSVTRALSSHPGIRSILSYQASQTNSTP